MGYSSWFLSNWQDFVSSRFHLECITDHHTSARGIILEIEANSFFRKIGGK